MTKRRDGLDAEYERRELDRPTRVGNLLGIKRLAPDVAARLGVLVEEFDWRGTQVWGAKR